MATTPSRWLSGILALVTVALAVATAARFGGSGGAEPRGLVLEPGPVLELGHVSPLRIDTLRGVLSVTRAVQHGRTWVLLDPASHQLHLWTPPGGPFAVGGRGEGPGELDRPAVMDVGAGLIAVVDRWASRADLFDLDGAFRERWPLAGDDCPFAQPVAVLATPEASFLLMLRCAAPGRGMWTRTLSIHPGDGVDVLGESIPTDRTALADLPMLGRHRGVFYKGTNGDPCVSALPETAVEGPESLCHPRTQGPPLPDSLRIELETFLGGARAGRTPVAVPERLPPLSGLSSSSGGALIFRVPTASAGEALDVVLGTRLFRIVPPEDAHVFAGRDEILVVRSLLEGVEASTIPWPESWPAQAPHR